MWLNEGFTVFEERKVTAKIHKSDDVRLEAAYLGNISMTNDMLGYGLDSNYSSLHPELGGEYNNLTSADLPDNSFSEIPYEKGFQFLYYLETILGEDMMQSLIQTHISTHAQTSIDYTAFQSVFNSFT
jgi:leukotriene-A4 hydrolase